MSKYLGLTLSDSLRSPTECAGRTDHRFSTGPCYNHHSINGLDHMSSVETQIADAFTAALNQEGADTVHEQLLEQGVESALPNLLQYSFNKQDDSLTGLMFNQYEIIRPIGSGGMAAVYLAKRNDGHYQKNVAIKILNSGYLTPDIKNRFLREQQILAELRHPGIVPLVDAGTTVDQMPWFALEFIDGPAIHDFCEQHNASMEARVRLFLKVCDAVQFAHSQGVLHRDLKPANILVESIDGKHQPVILDFGIAQKQNTPNLTSQGNIIGTPSYMSPEQIKGQSAQLDRRTDVFSLGVVLYRLLVGRVPFMGDTVVDTYQKIMQQPLDNIVASVPEFPRDLQTILATCLRKQAANRYQSVRELSQDLKNWLAGYPIKAQEQQLWVKLKSWYKRNKLAALVTISLVAVSSGLIIKYGYDINTERQLALESKQESDELLNFMLQDLHQQLTALGRVDVLEAVAVRSLAHLNKFQRIIPTEQYLKQATIYRNIAEVLDMQADINQAETALQQAKSLLLTLLEDEAQHQQALVALAACLVELADLHAKFGRLAEASGEYEEALNHAYQIQAIAGSDQHHITRWDVHNAYAWNLMEEGRYPKAKQQLNTALQISEEQLEQQADHLLWMERKLKTLTTFGWFYNETRVLTASQQLYLQALELAQTLHQKSPHSVHSIHGLRKVYNQLAYTYSVAADFTAAAHYAEQAKTHGIQLQQKAPGNQIYQRALAYTYTTLGDSYKQLQQLQQAATNYTAGLAISTQLAQLAPDNASLQNDLAIDRMNLGQLLMAQGNAESAQQLWQQAAAGIARFASQPEASIYYIDTYAHVLLLLNDTTAAAPYLQKLRSASGWGQEAYQQLAEQFKLPPETTAHD